MTFGIWSRDFLGIYQRVVVLGAGGFGTAMAHRLASFPSSKHERVLLWGRDSDVISSIQKENLNPQYTGDVRLHSNLESTDDLEQALDGAGLVIFSVPSQQLRAVCEKVRNLLDERAVLLNLAKGVERMTFLRMSEVIHQVLHRPSAVLSGPSFASDLLMGNPIGLTVAARNSQVRKRISSYLNSSEMDVKMTHDVAGVELGGALKNVFGLVSGMLDGLELGASIQGDFLSRAMVEMRDLGVFLGGRWFTFSGRSGIGDLSITCTNGSRNYRFGYAWSRAWLELDSSDDQHERAEKIAFESIGTRTVEGFDTMPAIHGLVDRARMHTPILHAGWRVLHEHSLSPQALLGEIRRLDSIRRKESVSLLSVLMRHRFPRLYFRRRYSSKRRRRSS